MALACPAYGPSEEFLRATLAVVDCYAQNLGASGYQALAAPGSPAAVALGGMLTIFVALFGYRMLFGQAPDARDAVLAIAKIGVVLALATSWPAFRTLAYDLTMRGPAELAATIGRPAGLPGTDGGLTARLQGVDDMLAELTVLGTGRPPQEIAGPTPALTEAQIQQELQRLGAIQDRPRWNADRDAKIVGQARTLFLTGAIGAFASVRLVAGLLLALAPLFALFLLFDATRGLFEGWLRVLAGAALGALATAIVLAVELALVEPFLAVVISERRANIPTPRVPIELLVMTLVFALALIAALVATARVARGFRIPQAVRLASGRWVETLRVAESRPAVAVTGARSEPIDERTRAAALADAVGAAQRREAFAGPAPHARLVVVPGENGGSARVAATTAAASEGMPGAAPAGGRRRTRGRISAGAGRRDSRT
jgi:type IV secretion system protein VirB6